MERQQVRTIKFRGKNINSNIWIYGYYWEDNVSEKTFILTGNYVGEKYSELPIIEQIEVEPETIGQFTGLQDVNEKDIYEGDRLKFTVFDHNDYDTQYEGIVKFSGSEWEIWKSEDNEYYGSDGAFHLYWTCSQDCEIEVIGNIHEKLKIV